MRQFPLFMLLTLAALALLRGASAHRPEPPASSELLASANGVNDAFASVGKFRGSLTCTGSLIDPSNSGASDARAWLLTAGHCISLEPYGIIRNQPLTATVVFNFFFDTPPDRRVTVRARPSRAAR